MANGYEADQYDVIFGNEALGVRFIQTIHAPKDSVVIHPKQFVKLLSHPLSTGCIDLLKG